MNFKFKVGDKIKTLRYVQIDGESFEEGSIGTIKIIDESMSFEDPEDREVVSGNEVPAYGISWEGFTRGHDIGETAWDRSGWWLPVSMIDEDCVLVELQLEFEF